MAITNFIPSIWSAQLLVALRKAHVYAQPGIINRDYEGEIRAAGDAVRITSIGRPTVKDYVPNSTTVTAEKPIDSQRSLVIDQMKYFSIGIDDVDAAQAKGAVLGQFANEAAYGVAEVLDQYVAGLYTQVQSANNLGTVAVTAVTDPYSKILLKLKQKLDEANVSRDGRWVVVPPWFETLMLDDSRFIKVNESGTSEGLRQGTIARAAGFDVILSNNAPLVTGDDYAVMAGVSSAITFASQLTVMEALRSTATFQDEIRALFVYGAKVLRPDSLAVAICSQS